MITFIFPGQGSQSKGMGGTLFNEFKELTMQADEILGYSIEELCLEDHNSNLNQTQYTQVAIYTVSALSYLKKISETNKEPDYVAGHSLGEYNALFAAGVFDFVTGLKMVKKRGELMSLASGGGMAAIIGLNEDQVADVLKQNNLLGIDIANLNSPSQIVISGSKSEIEDAKPIFEGSKGVKMFAPLKTSGAFHSRYMDESKKSFETFLMDFKLSAPQIPVISNLHARPYKESDIKRNLIEQITSPVKWTETIRYLMGRGDMEFEEVGAGKVLTGLVKRIKAEAEPLIIEDIEEDTTIQEQSALIDENIESGQKDLAEAKIEFPKISPLTLGSDEFKKTYNLKYAYLTGGMYKGISSGNIVVKMGLKGMMGFLGTGGLSISQISDELKYIQERLTNGQAYGADLVHNMNHPEMEEKTVDLFLKCGVKNIEASAFLTMSPALVRYRAKGLSRNRDGNINITNRIIAKLSRPEVAEAFLCPAPQRIVDKLIAENSITQDEADILKLVPMADDICVEADSGGHTDARMAYALMPAIIKLRNEIMCKYQYQRKVNVGAAGGIGTPESAAAAFILGADFIMTGSINQCTVEGNTSDAVKDLLQQMNVQDTDYVPAGDMFELGSKAQVLKRGVFFPARANKLYELYRQYNSLNEIDEKTRKQIQEKYFRRSFEDIFKELKEYYPPEEIEKAEANPKHKMALIFRWYFSYTNRLALNGNEEFKVDYQIQCGPALGAFNQWVKGTELENWRNRHIDQIGEKLMHETAEYLNKQIGLLTVKEATI